MKKIIFLSIISLSLCLPLFSCKKQSFRKGIKVGVISNYLDTSEVSEIKDAYDSVISWLKKNRIEYIFRKPNGNTSENRETSIRILNSSGCNYFITLGSEFGESIDFIKKRFPDNKTIAFDVSYDDVFYSVYEDYNPSKREEKIKEYKLGECIHLVDFKKEELGFIGGYSLIKEGNSNVGFLANKNTPENNHYGYGFIKGVEEASKELNKEVNIKYAYMNSNEKNNETIGRLDTWFGQGMESLFVTGRNAYKNAVHSASKNGVFGKVIIGDTNRSEELDSGYKDNILSYATKRYDVTIKKTLDKLINGAFENGMTEYNFASEAMEFLKEPWGYKKFTREDYTNLVKKINNNDYVIKSDLEDIPETTSLVHIDFQGNIK